MWFACAIRLRRFVLCVWIWQKEKKLLPMWNTDIVLQIIINLRNSFMPFFFWFYRNWTIAPRTNKYSLLQHIDTWDKNGNLTARTWLPINSFDSSKLQGVLTVDDNWIYNNVIKKIYIHQLNGQLMQHKKWLGQYWWWMVRNSNTLICLLIRSIYL